MKYKLVFISFLLFSSILFILYSISSTATASPELQSMQQEEEQIRKAVNKAINGERELVLAYTVFNVQVADIHVSNDSSVGIAYLEMIDPETGEILPSEPGVAIAEKELTGWRIILPSDPAWLSKIDALPGDIASEEFKELYGEMYRLQQVQADTTYHGYFLPWEAGKTVYLSQSVGHDRYIPSGSAHYAFDFYISKTMYRLNASKAGIVWRARWDVPNGNDSDMGNYLVLKDTTTSPTTYQLYLHLAQNSIPSALRTQGTYVAQGQFIGMSDDTGQSTGHHLHFQVHTNPYSYWGTSVDVTFDDVDINGGRPRTWSDADKCIPGVDVCTSFRSSYVSGNYLEGDVTPPTADITQPETGNSITSKVLHVEGWVKDTGSGLEKAALIAYFNNQWQEVGNTFTSPSFSLDWDMCGNNVPDGPLSIAVRAWDKAGNFTFGLPGLTHLIKDYSCQPITPQCTPGPNQVGIYSQSDFHGSCQVLDIGNYPDPSMFNHVGDDGVQSIQVGANVLAQLFSEINYSGRSFTINRDDSNLEDNPIGSKTVSSIRVSARSQPPATPNQLLFPGEGDEFPFGSSISFSWRDAGGATQYRVSIEGSGGIVNSPWVSDAFLHIGGKGISVGEYNWRVQARNCDQASCQSAWSTPSTFKITSAGPSLLVGSTPFSDDLESGGSNWLASGLWNLLEDDHKSHDNSGTSWYYGQPVTNNFDNGTVNSGDLTLRPILIPDTGYALRFWYIYDTEDPASNYDQRWIQISTNGEPFQNVLQLTDDVKNYWLQATLDLTAYAGQTIQVRFHFTSLDEQLNIGEGWRIDDVEIDQIQLPTCSDQDNAHSQARDISYGQTLNGSICPFGDIDYYKFEGKAGDHIVLDIDTPQSDPVDGLDMYLFLLDRDGRSVLASHDDEILGKKFDPHLGYQLGRTGTYIVRVRLWSHPTLGGDDFVYNLTLSKDNLKPEVKILYPKSGSFLPASDQFKINVEASDTSSGISHVEYLYHSGDWLNSSWQLLGTDFDGSDGWNLVVDPSSIPEQVDIAIIVKAFDWAGNWIINGAWGLGMDRSSPTTSLDSLPSQQGSTAILLTWNGNDNLSGLDYYDLQFKTNDGPWMDFDADLDGTAKSMWFIGQSGNNYGFRLRGIDKSGNIEPYPSSAEATTVVPAPQILCSSPDPWDNFDNDNSHRQATEFKFDEQSRVYNFCNPLTSDRLNDEDWVKFSVQAGEKYLIKSYPLGGMTASILELYSPDGNTLLSSVQPKKFGGSTQIIRIAERDETWFLRVRHLDWRVAGNDVLYRLSISKYQNFYLPLINH